MKTLLILLVFLCAVSAEAAQERGWEKEWEQTLAAARKEGRVTVATSPDPAMREIAARFKARFDITVEHLAVRSSELAPRLRAERAAGLRTVDIVMSGIEIPATYFYPEKMLEPLRTALILPEAIAPSKWKKGRLWFADPEEKYILRVFNSITGEFHINSDHVQPAAIRSARDLLNPNWRGKISVLEPTVPGAGAMQAHRFYVQFGEEFVRKLYVEQKPAVARERRQLTDWLVHGVYPITLNARRQDMEAMRQEGFRIDEIIELPDMPAIVGGSPWLLSLMSQAPHPNAARVFANWIISKEGLEIYSRGEGAATLRNDVDESFLKPEIIPRPGVNYFDDFDWNWVVSGKEKVRQRIKKILGKR